MAKWASAAVADSGPISGVILGDAAMGVSGVKDESADNDGRGARVVVSAAFRSFRNVVSRGRMTISDIRVSSEVKDFRDDRRVSTELALTVLLEAYDGEGEGGLMVMQEEFVDIVAVSG